MRKTFDAHRKISTTRTRIFRPFRFRSSAARAISAGSSPPPSGWPDEKIFGGGESFTRLNKRGQKVNLSRATAWACRRQLMYKPIPFFMSSRGYGMFMHTSTPITFDFGQTYDQHNVIYIGDDDLDLFVFLGRAEGDPRRIHGAHRRSPGAAAVVVRFLDEPHHLQVRGRGPRRRGEAARSTKSRAT